MITRKMRLSMAMLTIAASVLTTGNIKADEKIQQKKQIQQRKVNMRIKQLQIFILQQH